MEPFTIQCETCRTKLRVRDERVLGQIHECPRCGSMVMIAAPAAATTEIAPPTPPVAAAHIPRGIFWAATGAAVCVAVGLVGFVALRGDEAEVATAAAPDTPAVAISAEEVPREDDKRMETPVAEKSTAAEPAVEVAAETDEELEIAPAPSEVLSVIEPAASQPVAAAVIPPPQVATVEAEKPQPARRMTLEPVEPTATIGELAEQVETPRYEAVEAEAETAAPAPPAVQVPARVTNVKDQLALPVATMEIHAMPLSSFVEMISEMAAVPIALDAAALEAARVSPRTKISVSARDETLESLLTETLARHQLAWEERDGQLIVVHAN